MKHVNSSAALAVMFRTGAMLSLTFLSLSWAASTSAAGNPPSYTQPVAPFRIAPGIYYVGTKGLSAYLLTSSRGAILINGTVAENAALIERNIETLGVPLKSVRWIVSDHAHNDHVGALAQIKSDTGARFAASAGDREALQGGAPRGDTNFDQSEYGFSPIKIDRIIKDGESISLGDVTLTAHLTPGHTPGCTSWSTVTAGHLRHRVLFLCSVTIAGNRLIGNRAYPTIVADYRSTFAKLSRMNADIVLTSHPDMDFADVLGRKARIDGGDPLAFVDHGVLRKIVAQSKQDFEAALFKERQSSGWVETPRR